MNEQQQHPKRRKGGRTPKSAPAFHRETVNLDAAQHARFLTLYEQSGLSSKSKFIAARIFGDSFRVIRTDRGTMEYVARLTALYQQYRAVGGELQPDGQGTARAFYREKGVGLLYFYKLEKLTLELVALSRRIVDFQKNSKGMVAKISTGKDLYGALAYNQTKVEEGHAKILDANLLPYPEDGHFRMGGVMEAFTAWLPSHYRTEKPVIHISLNPHPDDVLTDGQLAAIGREYMEKLGYGSQPFLIFKHEDIDRHHIHIVSLRVDSGGQEDFRPFRAPPEQRDNRTVGTDVRAASGQGAEEGGGLEAPPGGCRARRHTPADSRYRQAAAQALPVPVDGRVPGFALLI